MRGNIKTANKIEKELKIVTFTDGTDEQIAAMLDAHYNGDINIKDYWHVGNTRTIHLNSIADPNGSSTAWKEQDITIVITEINHYDLTSPIGIRTKAAITCQTRECVNDNLDDYDIDGHISWNIQVEKVTDPDIIHWSALKIRAWGNNTFFDTAMPTEIKEIIKPIKHNVLSTRGCSGTTVNGTPPITTTEEVIDKIFLPTYPEIFGNTPFVVYLSGSTPAGEEGTQWEYYKTESNRIKYGNNNGISNNNAQDWWYGSPSTHWSSTGGGRFGLVYADGTAGVQYADSTYGYAPVFCL